MTHRQFASTVLVLACLGLAPLPSPAAESYDNCAGFIDSVPATISTQGVWCLRKDLSTAMSSGAAITVATNNVTIDCNEFKLGGLAAGVGTTARGIQSDARSNITVRHCNVRGFREGISLGSGSGHVVEDNRLEANTFAGIALALSEDSVVRRNIVRDTGGSTALLQSAIGISTWGTVDVLDNTISGVAPTPNSEGLAQPFGIVVRDSVGASIRGNRIRGLLPAGEGMAYGIESYGTSRVDFVDNQLVGTGGPGIGINCVAGTGRVRNNLFDGFSTALVPVCTDAGGNTVLP